ncbi:hypothetical protein CHARACLAT_019497 [Characodon lateralis]|uniref:Uncharacterized protein n=1 Tax=Characodon lateralis TaxID=208331 RepID=A0ABU7CRM2_9TELE|nr:hypothetical protein [Characodon lateralis]
MVLVLAMLYYCALHTSCMSFDRSFAMWAEISRGLCGSHMLDIPIETVKNRWSLEENTELTEGLLMRAALLRGIMAVYYRKSQKIGYITSFDLLGGTDVDGFKASAEHIASLCDNMEKQQRWFLKNRVGTE